MRTRAAWAAGWLMAMVVSADSSAAATKIEKPFRSVYFAFGNAELTPEAKEVLAAHATRLREHSNLRLEVQGWDDYFLGKADLRLSLKRAEEVRAFLAAQGLDSSRLKVRDMGAAPWDPGRRASPATLRRVDFAVLEEEPVPASPAPAPVPAAAPPTPVEVPPPPPAVAPPPPKPAVAPPAPEPVASAPAPAGTPEIQNPLAEERSVAAVEPKR
ncbi:MAG: OmpA family protein, partial [Nitrospirae bacterium]|nr:OmpA family protein [Nitrospirota bacterium]